LAISVQGIVVGSPVAGSGEEFSLEGVQSCGQILDDSEPSRSSMREVSAE
jgi:hypothetical protein